MSYRRLLNQPITIERRGTTTTDEFNNEVPGTTSTVSTVGYVERTAAEEFTVDRETYITDWRVFLPAGTAIDGSDRILHGTKTLQVVGNSGDGEWNPRTRVYHHVEVRAREVTG